MISRDISIAPMMGWTDRHARFFLRLITRHSLLYTEMVNTGALLHNDQKVGVQKRLLAYHASEHPVALQLGGSDPAALAQCTVMAEDAGFDEVNLNVGCPSDRVKSGNFGACLMATPEVVADCISAMQEKVTIPVTVKCRIGIDDMESFESFENFISKVAETGCDTFIVHARNAWLKGLSPKQNREIPPLKYDFVHRLKNENPSLTIVINGGIKTMETVKQQLQHVDGAMLGREAYHNPFIMNDVDGRIYGEEVKEESRFDILESYIEYMQKQLDNDVFLKHMSRHILGLFPSMAGAKAWRRHISENAYKKESGIEVIRTAADFLKV